MMGFSSALWMNNNGQLKRSERRKRFNSFGWRRSTHYDIWISQYNRRPPLSPTLTESIVISSKTQIHFDWLYFTQLYMAECDDPSVGAETGGRGAAMTNNKLCRTCRWFESTLSTLSLIADWNGGCLQQPWPLPVVVSLVFHQNLSPQWGLYFVTEIFRKARKR